MHVNLFQKYSVNYCRWLFVNKSFQKVSSLFKLFVGTFKKIFETLKGALIHLLIQKNKLIDVNPNDNPSQLIPNQASTEQREKNLLQNEKRR